MSLADGESQDYEGAHRGELRPGGDILEQCTPAQSHNVNEREDDDQREPNRMRAREYDGEYSPDKVAARQRGIWQIDVRHHMLLRHPWNDVAHVGRGGDGEGGDGAAIGDCEQHPAVKKGDQVAVRFAQVNVLSAGVGKHRAEFGKGDAGAQRDHSTEDPHQKKQRRIRQRPGNILSGKKNRRADDAADQQQHGVEQTKPADETRFLRRGFGFGGHLHPMPNSSGDSSGVPQRRQMTAEQSPQVSGSLTSVAQTGQYNTTAGFWASGAAFGTISMTLNDCL